MKFEQPAALNKFVTGSMPFTWKKRWQSLQFIFPLGFCITLLMWEITIVGAWLNDRAPFQEPYLFLLVPMFVFGAPLLGAELQFRLESRCKRVLRFEEKRIRINHSKFALIPWKRILSWRFEEIATEPFFKKFTVEFAVDKKLNTQRTWSIVLDAAQIEVMHRELQKLSLTGKTYAPLLVGSKPTVKPIPLAAGVLWSVGAAYLFLIHGISLLMAGFLFMSEPNRTDNREPRKPSKNMERLVGKMFDHYFFTPKELGRCFIILGSGMIAITVVIHVAAMRGIERERRLLKEANSAAAPA